VCPWSNILPSNSIIQCLPCGVNFFKDVGVSGLIFRSAVSIVCKHFRSFFSFVSLSLTLIMMHKDVNRDFIYSVSPLSSSC